MSYNQRAKETRKKAQNFYNISYSPRELTLENEREIDSRPQDISGFTRMFTCLYITAALANLS